MARLTGPGIHLPHPQAGGGGAIGHTPADGPVHAARSPTSYLHDSRLRFETSNGQTGLRCFDNAVLAQVDGYHIRQVDDGSDQSGKLGVLDAQLRQRQRRPHPSRLKPFAALLSQQFPPNRECLRVVPSFAKLLVQLRLKRVAVEMHNPHFIWTPVNVLLVAAAVHIAAGEILHHAHLPIPNTGQIVEHGWHEQPGHSKIVLVSWSARRERKKQCAPAHWVTATFSVELTPLHPYGQPNTPLHILASLCACLHLCTPLHHCAHPGDPSPTAH